MQVVDSGFIRRSHERCEECDIREDLHASGAAIPQRRHRIAKCEACKGVGELPLGVKDGADPYRTQPKPGREQFFAARRAVRARNERHRFRPKTHQFEECELVMQIPPGGFNHGRAKSEDGTWRPLESEGRDGDILWHPSFKREPQPLKHGTAYAYVKVKCRCFECRRWNASRIRSYRQDVTTPVGRGQVSSSAGPPPTGAFPDHEAIVSLHGEAA